ncbi:chromosome transmission fidelity protein 18 homolog [Macrobrachium nipponense]|uniref:chromosome transmission fidelity protein 18 homolog n=1 Tax=Macrobrachium nipponense TaxID=159736 RepID=UPI0030C8A87F
MKEPNREKPQLTHKPELGLQQKSYLLPTTESDASLEMPSPKTARLTETRSAYLMNMEEIVRFPDLKPEKQLTYATRQLIAREIELEKVRRAELYFTNQKTKEAEKMKAYADEKKKSSSDPVPVVVPNHLQKLKAKPLPEGSDGKKGSGVSKVVDVAQVPKDFFGRVIDRQALQEDKSATNEIVKSDIWFRFKEGYSNAVRRPVKMKDLF